MVELLLPGVQHRGRTVYYGDMAEIELKTFGARVAWLLQRRRLAGQEISSQKELAVKIGMKPQQLNAYTTGRRSPNVRHLRAIAAALETSVSFLALTKNTPEPDDSEPAVDDGEGAGLSMEASEAADLVDGMSEDLREIALDLLRVLAMHDVEGDTDPTRLTGGASGRLILGKLLKDVRKSAGLPGASTRINSK